MSLKNRSYFDAAKGSEAFSERQCSGVAPSTINSTLRAGVTFWIVFIVLVVGTTYLPSLGCKFVLWDDDINLLRNWRLLNADYSTLEGWKWTLQTDYAAVWQPLDWIRDVFLYILFGLHPLPFHAASYILHLSNTLLIFALLVRVCAHLGRRGDEVNLYCGLLSLFWAVHPLRVEAVTWVSAISYPQATFFLLLALHSYFTYRVRTESSSFALYLVTFFCFAAGVLSHPVLASTPFLLVIADLYVFRIHRLADVFRFWRPERIRYCFLIFPFLVPSIISLIVSLGASLESVEYYSQQQAFSSGSLLNSVNVTVSCLTAPFKVFDLLPLQERFSIQTTWPLPFLGNLGLLLLLAGITFWRWPRSRPFAILCGCYALCLLPVLGLNSPDHAVHDRYTYTADVFWIFMLVTLSSFLISENLTSLKRFQRHFLLAGKVAACLLLLFLSMVTIRQQQIWKDTVTLMTELIARCPWYADQATLHSRLAQGYMNLSQVQSASRFFEKALELNPQSESVRYQRGIFFMKVGILAKAEREFLKVVELNPTNYLSFFALGMIKEATGQPESAVPFYLKALEHTPAASPTRSEIGLRLQTARRAKD